MVKNERCTVDSYMVYKISKCSLFFYSYHGKKKNFSNLFYATNIFKKVTVGFGDIRPSTEAEIILCIVTILVSCGVFAYSINSIGFIFQ